MPKYFSLGNTKSIKLFVKILSLRTPLKEYKIFVQKAIFVTKVVEVLINTFLAVFLSIFKMKKSLQVTLSFERATEQIWLGKVVLNLCLSYFLTFGL